MRKLSLFLGSVAVIAVSGLIAGARVEAVPGSATATTDAIGQRLALAGNYTLAIDAASSCSLLPDLKHRLYDAVVTQKEWDLRVTLTEKRFAVNVLDRGNQFTGRVTGNGATFTIHVGLAYFAEYLSSAYYPDLVERLSDGSVLIVEGLVTTTGSAAGLSGQLDGGIFNYGVGFPERFFPLGRCLSPARFTLTPR